MVEAPLALGTFGFYVFAATGPAVSLGISGLYLQIIVIVVCIGLVAFFSSAEASLISVNKLRIRYLAEQGNRSARVVARVLEHHEKFFATILLTENAFIIFASSLGTAVAINLAGGNPVLVLMAPLVMTVVIVTFGEITPQNSGGWVIRAMVVDSSKAYQRNHVPGDVRHIPVYPTASLSGQNDGERTGCLGNVGDRRGVADAHRHQ